MTLGSFDWAVLAVLGTWLLATLVSHVPTRRLRWIKDVDPFGLIPGWTFFAPKPATTDLHLLYRDRLDDGCCTEWREIPFAERRRLLHAVWNPGKRYRKALFDICMGLAESAIGSEHDPATMKLSIPYLLLLTYVGSVDHLPGARAVQFSVVTSFGMVSDREPEVLFLSEFHGL